VPRRTAFCSGTPEDDAMKYEMLMLRALLATSMLVCGLTLFQMV
jgi:hypothetical protein